MTDTDFEARAQRIVLMNDQAELHARLAAQEHYIEHGEYPPAWQIDVWANEYRDQHEQAVDGLSKALEADYNFKVLTDQFSEEEYGEDDGEFGLDEYCELCHDAPEGCEACQD